MYAIFLLPLIGQASITAIDPTAEQTRMDICMEQANNDPASAISSASVWLGEAYEAEAAYPHQCLGIAYTRLSRWQAAEQSFLAARDVAPDSDLARKARLGGMAGNSALAENRFEDAFASLERALSDARRAGQTALAGELAADLSRALIGLGRIEDAQLALREARRDNPQGAEVWLLSATLSRRLDDLAIAQSQIETAVLLAPLDVGIGLEAGLIAALSGNDEAARKSWQSVISVEPESDEAATAQDYLAQLDQLAVEAEMEDDF
jgi:tetratricopeptide (TPR) repeat protein